MEAIGPTLTVGLPGMRELGFRVYRVYIYIYMHLYTLSGSIQDTSFPPLTNSKYNSKLPLDAGCAIGEDVGLVRFWP